MNQSIVLTFALTAAWAASLPVQAQSIVAVPASGTADAGIASRPIVDIAANDTVNGAVATLGTTGNATVAKVGTWPTGIGLDPATGAVSTKIAVLPGLYTFQYQLCDKNTPPDCATATDTVTVTTASIVPLPDSGIAALDTASTPIANVEANDEIDGAAATLGSSGNSTIAQVGTWPTGIALNTKTGAITTTAAVPMGTYDIQYQLCDRNLPADCATATDTVTVENAIAANPDAGSAIVGVASIAIANVAVNDLVNDVPAVLGSSGNATVAMIGTWPSGIALNAATGAITSNSTVAQGSYHVEYQLCDKNSVPDCATATDSVLVTPPFEEVRASPYVYGDVEFDWARDGVYCGTCNDNLSNAQFNWTDHANNLWVSGIDRKTGVFIPVQGNQTLVDTNAFFWEDWGNGPEWGFSTQNGSVMSQLVYTRYAPGGPPTGQYAGAALGTVVDGQWQVAFLPGAYGAGDDHTVLPEASQCNSDPVSLSVFKNLATPTVMFTEPVSTATGTAPTATPFGAYANGIGERWVPCTHQLTFQGNVTVGTNVLQQVFWYDTDTQAVQQLTFDPTTKQRAVMFKAPEFTDASGNAQYILMALAGQREIQIYLQNGSYANGAPHFKLVNTIYSPDPEQPYMFDAKAFIHCNAVYPTCQTYVVMGMDHTARSQLDETKPNGMGVTNIDPQNPLFEVLASYVTLPYTQRVDPKYFIGPNGPAVYYDRLLTASATQPYASQGVYFINMQLGAPSGSCVGSSAEGGLTANWPNCSGPTPP